MFHQRGDLRTRIRAANKRHNQGTKSATLHQPRMTFRLFIVSLEAANVSQTNVHPESSGGKRQSKERERESCQSNSLSCFYLTTPTSTVLSFQKIGLCDLSQRKRKKERKRIHGNLVQLFITCIPRSSQGLRAGEIDSCSAGGNGWVGNQIFSS